MLLAFTMYKSPFRNMLYIGLCVPVSFIPQCIIQVGGPVDVTLETKPEKRGDKVRHISRSITARECPWITVVFNPIIICSNRKWGTNS